MHFPIPPYHPKPVPEPPAIFRAAARADVIWDRPIFKAPPLQLPPHAFNAVVLAQELPRAGLGSRS